MTDEPFTLDNTPAPRRREKPPKAEPQKQFVLFSGLDCLPDQTEMFDETEFARDVRGE